MDEEEMALLAEYRRGRVGALEKLVERYRRPLFGFIYKMTEGRGDPEEVFQEVWIRAIRKLDGFHERNMLGWLFRIAHNFVIDEGRRRKPLVPLGDGTVAEDGSYAPEPADRGLGPDGEAAGRDMGARIAQALDRLSTEQKEVFLMRTQAQLPFKDIARIQRVSINTALARMQYALQKLRGELQADYDALEGGSR